MGGHRDAKVVIIGCGIAGIAAAHKLVKAGFHHVRILEATGRSGGRIKTGRIGRELNAEDILSAQKLFLELINESSDFQSQRGEPWPSVGDFLRAQVQQHAAEKWKDVDEATRSLRLCVISNMLKVECCVNGTHSMDEVSMGAFGLYKTLPGLDCTFPGRNMTEDYDQTMDPAAHNPSAELQEDMIYAVEFLCQEWFALPFKEYQEELARRLQRMISGLPWLFGSLHPLIQDFLVTTVHVRPEQPLLYEEPEDFQLSPLEDSQADSSPSSSRRKRRSRRHRSTAAEQTTFVAQYIKFEIPVLDSFVEKLKEEEEREIIKLTKKYSALKSMILHQLEDRAHTDDRA
ncbi:uncharacterized protein LOC134639615 [Pelmatolapia mariae]|uniref:uncharacterized protein LOC134639615 n=1 Tax=Pelmatolapia mariae TaxID=158779 RepID=UPI002FE556E1